MFLKAKEKNEPNETQDTRNIDYKEDKASTRYDKKFDDMDQKFNEAAQNFFTVKNFADSNSSFNPPKKCSIKENLNENLNEFNLRNLDNEN